MKTFFIHAGTYKTGTSTIQNMIYDNRGILEEKGFYYPEAGLTKARRLGIRHYYLMYEIVRGNQLNYWKELLKEISKVEQEKILLSHENFFSPSIDPKKIVSRLDGYEIKLIVYLRNPIDYIESCYREWVQNVDKYDKSIDVFFSWRKKWLSYKKMIEKWERVIGSENISIGIFDKNCLYMNDIKFDFLRKIGLKDIKIRENENYNRTLKSNEILKILLMNREVKGELYLNSIERILENSFERNNSDRRIVNDTIIETIRNDGYEKEFLFLRDSLGFYYDGKSKFLSLPYDDLFDDIEKKTRKV